jgi:hypothetical protein
MPKAIADLDFHSATRKVIKVRFQPVAGSRERTSVFDSRGDSYFWLKDDGGHGSFIRNFVMNCAIDLRVDYERVTLVFSHEHLGKGIAWVEPVSFCNGEEFQ